MSILPVTCIKEINDNNLVIERNGISGLNYIDTKLKFPEKLWLIISQNNGNTVYWSDDGTQFFLRTTYDFINIILPRYFQHNKLASAERQLNVYGFKRIARQKDDLTIYSHPNFQRGRKDLIPLIKRIQTKSIRPKRCVKQSVKSDSLTHSNHESTLLSIHSVSKSKEIKLFRTLNEDVGESLQHHSDDDDDGGHNDVFNTKNVSNVFNKNDLLLLSHNSPPNIQPLIMTNTTATTANVAASRSNHNGIHHHSSSDFSTELSEFATKYRIPYHIWKKCEQDMLASSHLTGRSSHAVNAIAPPRHIHFYIDDNDNDDNNTVINTVHTSMYESHHNYDCLVDERSHENHYYETISNMGDNTYMSSNDRIPYIVIIPSSHLHLPIPVSVSSNTQDNTLDKYITTQSISTDNCSIQNPSHTYIRDNYITCTTTTTTTNNNNNNNNNNKTLSILSDQLITHNHNDDHDYVTIKDEATAAVIVTVIDNDKVTTNEI